MATQSPLQIRWCFDFRKVSLWWDHDWGGGGGGVGGGRKGIYGDQDFVKRKKNQHGPPNPPERDSKLRRGLKTIPRPQEKFR